MVDSLPLPLPSEATTVRKPQLVRSAVDLFYFIFCRVFYFHISYVGGCGVPGGPEGTPAQVEPPTAEVRREEEARRGGARVAGEAARGRPSGFEGGGQAGRGGLPPGEFSRVQSSPVQSM